MTKQHSLLAANVATPPRARAALPTEVLDTEWARLRREFDQLKSQTEQWFGEDSDSIPTTGPAARQSTAVPQSVAAQHAATLQPNVTSHRYLRG